MKSPMIKLTSTTVYSWSKQVIKVVPPHTQTLYMFSKHTTFKRSAQDIGTWKLKFTCTSRGKSLSSRFSRKTPLTLRRSTTVTSPLALELAVNHVASLVSLRMLSMYNRGFQNFSSSALFSS